MKKSWRIVPPLALATTLHAMVLSGVVPWHGGGSAGAEDRAHTVTSRLSVRLAAPSSPRPVPLSPAAEVTRQTTVAPTEAPEATAAAEPVLASGTELVTPTALPPSPPPEAAPEAATATQPALTPPTAEGWGDPQADRYHARRELSRPPKPLTPIDIVFPPGVPTPGRHSAVLALYIDELGHVRKVHTEGEALPQAFEDAARNAFLSAQFRAGELGGRAVKSYIHVEVVFDEQPEARGLAASALGQSLR